jgi:mono/diheme cytochrome c family protein
MVRLGDSVFHARTGDAVCFTCHGPNAEGTSLAPSLRQGRWLNTDGSYGGILTVIRGGVGVPKQSPNPMPPMGGATHLSEEELRAVAAYVYQISRAKPHG